MFTTVVLHNAYLFLNLRGYLITFILPFAATHTAPFLHMYEFFYHHIDLQISFQECDYSITEGFTQLNWPISLEFYGPTENSFSLTLSTVSIDRAEADGLSAFIDFGGITSAYRATAGK